KTKIETKLKERLSFVDHLIRENQIKDAIKNLNEIQDLSKTYGLIEILNECEEQLTYCNKLYSEIIDKIRKNVLDISTKFARLQIIDISEKTEIPDEDLIISVIQEMIQNNEIFGEYFSSSQAIAFDQQKNLEKQGKLVSVYAKVKLKEEKEYNVFLSYSTKDSDHFDMASIVTSLENYPDIGRVLYWEADSKQNIVEFMDETLKKCNVFILFCSENSIKSAAVKDEWQAAFQRRKKELLKFIPVYEKEEQIPPILGHLLNVKFEKEDFNSFIEKLHQEIQR
ncbi:MAG: toll/interleukin-1 receptor domain-containing protein, partial [Candidatus Lokiarchaeota archaeon]|nr:toll/interleukin-1 receptor domain-containing protein [Candidatus Lokiarchaeota archaeon]